MERGARPFERIGLAFVIVASTFLGAASANENDWSVSCRKDGRTLYSEVMSESLVEDAVAGARRLFPGSTCISTSVSIPVPSVDVQYETGLDAALAALQGESPGVQDPAAITPAIPIEVPEPVVADPPIPAGHLRLASYKDVPLEIVLSDWERLETEHPTLSRYFPKLTTLGSLTTLDVGPLSAGRQAQTCFDIANSGGSCRRGPETPTVSISDLLPFSLGSASLPSCVRLPHDEQPMICPRDWIGRSAITTVMTAMVDADIDEPAEPAHLVPIPTPAPRS